MYYEKVVYIVYDFKKSLKTKKNKTNFMGTKLYEKNDLYIFITSANNTFDIFTGNELHKISLENLPGEFNIDDLEKVIADMQNSEPKYDKLPGVYPELITAQPLKELPPGFKDKPYSHNFRKQSQKYSKSSINPKNNHYNRKNNM